MPKERTDAADHDHHEAVDDHRRAHVEDGLKPASSAMPARPEP